MYKNAFGTNRQLKFNAPADYYKFLGFLSRDDGTTRIVWEHNDEQGAWGEEGRIQFYAYFPPDLKVELTRTAGAGNIVFRVNCNEFVDHIIRHHNFSVRGRQNQVDIRQTIPSDHLEDFDAGLTLDA